MSVRTDCDCQYCDAFSNSAVKVCDYYADEYYETGIVEQRMVPHCVACKLIEFGRTKTVLDLPGGNVTVEHPEFVRLRRADTPGGFFRLIQFAMSNNFNIMVMSARNFFKNIFHYMKHFDNIEISENGYVLGARRYGLFNTVETEGPPNSVYLPHFIETCVKLFD
jgi:hypothetical protein